MKKTKVLLLAFAVGLGISAYSSVQSVQTASAETIVCPGSGERCASKKIIFGLITVWSKKDVGGPGIIITEE
jgi:hypothetical protein